MRSLCLSSESEKRGKTRGNFSRDTRPVSRLTCHSLVYFKPVEDAVRLIARRMRTEEPGGPNILRTRVSLVADEAARIVAAGVHGTRAGRGRGSSHGLSLRKVSPFVSMGSRVRCRERSRREPLRILGIL